MLDNGKARWLCSLVMIVMAGCGNPPTPTPAANTQNPLSTTPSNPGGE